MQITRITHKRTVVFDSNRMFRRWKDRFIQWVMN